MMLVFLIEFGFNFKISVMEVIFTNVIYLILSSFI